jgi:putative endonuclease
MPALRLCRAPDAAQRVALAKRCAAEPGPYQTPVLGTVPVLRSITPRRAARCIAPGTRMWHIRIIEMSRSYFVYILANRARGVLYVGVTNNLSRRISEHRAKIVPGFASEHGLVLLVHVEEYASILEARAREHALKRWRRAWKFELIEKNNPNWRDLSSDLAF